GETVVGAEALFAYLGFANRLVAERRRSRVGATRAGLEIVDPLGTTPFVERVGEVLADGHGLSVRAGWGSAGLRVDLLLGEPRAPRAALGVLCDAVRPPGDG